MRSRRKVLHHSFLTCFILASALSVTAWAQSAAWERFTIDDKYRGADGVRMADANGDGQLDLVTGWEESGLTRVYLHPGPLQVKSPWPAVTIGQTPSVEDAVWVDLNGDSHLDVLTSCEGKEQSLWWHVCHGDDWLQAENWRTEVIPASRQLTRWMFATPISDPPSSASRETRVFLGSKNPNGMVAMLRAPLEREPPEWTITPLAAAEWIMSLEALDVDGDGDIDCLYTDRKGDQSGLYWLENRGDDTWPRHLIGGLGREVMFVSVLPPAADAPLQVVVAVKPHEVFWFSAQDSTGKQWSLEIIALPQTERIGNAKGIAVGDLDMDGVAEIVFSCEGADAPKSGVVYFKRDRANGQWQLRDVSGPAGIKFDLLQLVDLDGDGDLDILTCEEREGGLGLGLIWYANPLRSPGTQEIAK